MPKTSPNLSVRLSPTALQALHALAKASGCTMTRIIESLLIRAYDEHMANPERPVSFPKERLTVDSQ